MKKILFLVVAVLLVGGAYLYSRQFQVTKSENQELTISPTVKVKNDEELIRQALFTKNNWKESDNLNVVTKTNDGKYASGSVNGTGGGGLWFAQKVNGEWKIVADGNGIPTCEQLSPYPDFPNTLIKGCFDAKTESIVNR